MEKEFAKVMSERTDEELIRIVTVERERYNATAIEAADAEVEKRNIDKSEFEKIKEQATVKIEQKQKVDSNVVSSGIRFLHYIIDLIIFYLLILVIFIILGLFITPTSDNYIGGLLTFITIFGAFLTYYAVMEIKFQKTVGKFITKTKVVRIDGNKATTSEIIIRTICRLIPFDGISYLFVKNGFHDYLSKTKVIKGNPK
ncbi:RDD family protein [Mangrovimonas futianensis]|uniref:RDD family protein n=1 Tax=Mangrovimonas futianensis TaxID=2895523 RepID=UPI001E46CDEF|nr:RDD family protein [Mangrovimonas futianensis]MCF1423156.1 RDD family protein [Mangrovimonas futianensis]